MMNYEASQIDRIVREVLRRLEQTPADKPVSPPVASPPVATVDSADAATLRLDERVVTGDLLGNRLNGVRRIEVRDDAVVTPLVRDLLREKDIQLQRVTRRQPTAARRWLLVEPGNACHPESLLKQLKAIDADWMSIGDWQQVLESVAMGDSAIVVTSAWAARVCQANRRETVRAVNVVDTATVQQAVDQADANLFVVNADQVDEATVVEIARKVQP
jgi:hypothetical protein